MTSHSPSADPSGPAPTVPLVLIVDDNDKNRKLARDVLRAAGLVTLEAASATEALALATTRLPDVILLDLGLPDMVGTEVARELRDRARTAHIPLVALSALPDAGNHDWLRAAGFTGFLSKPIDVAAFPDQVRRYYEADRP
jgi:two-component system, cell cycle response regulator DivK